MTTILANRVGSSRRLGDDPYAGFRSFGARHHAAHVVSIDGDSVAALLLRRKDGGGDPDHRDADRKSKLSSLVLRWALSTCFEHSGILMKNTSP